MRLTILLLSATLLASAAGPQPFFNGKNLDGWDVIGDGQWTVMADGTLIGQRIGDLRKMLIPGGPFSTPAQFSGWVNTQSWLYTSRNDFGEFDLHLEYWTKTSGNSGVSIRDTSRAKWAVVTPPDYKKTPSKIGYEIQINNRFPDPHPSGSFSLNNHMNMRSPNHISQSFPPKTAPASVVPARVARSEPRTPVRG